MTMENKKLKNVLWGAGRNGAPVLFALAVLGIYIDVFCDNDMAKQGLKFCNKLVLSPESILNNSSEYQIIISVDNEKYLQDILNLLESYGVEKVIRWRDITGASVVRYSDLVRGLSKESVYNIIRDSYTKRLMIYGGRESAEGLKQLLSMLDIQIEYLIDDAEIACEQEKCVIRSVYDLLDEDVESFKVIVTSDKEANYNILEQMGLKMGVDYSFARHYAYTANRKCILDTNLGYSFSTEKNDLFPGFVELGNLYGTKIVLLGGSTTDELLYPFKSWGCCLADKFKQNGYNVQILNGGCRGYKSSQELIKLIRDIIPIRPDIVIDYTGVNDLPIILVQDQGRKYPFIHQYQKELFEQISKESISDSSGRVTNSESFTMGVADERPVWNRLADNIKMMDSICRNFGIIYRSFLQPFLLTKEGKDMELYMHLEFTNQDLEEMISYYENARKVRPDCMEDITDIFDDESDIYLDICHVTEHGNEVIAQYMFEYFTERGLVKR